MLSRIFLRRSKAEPKPFRRQPQLLAVFLYQSQFLVSVTEARYRFARPRYSALRLTKNTNRIAIANSTTPVK